MYGGRYNCVIPTVKRRVISERFRGVFNGALYSLTNVHVYFNSLYNEVYG